MTNMFDLSLLLVLGILTITHVPSEQVCVEEANLKSIPVLNLVCH